MQRLSSNRAASLGLLTKCESRSLRCFVGLGFSQAARPLRRLQGSFLQSFVGGSSSFTIHL
jgi:hypothetical protein